MMTKKEARKGAKKLKKLLRGSGWKTEVWENLGWHFAADNGPLRVHGGSNNFDKGTYSCLMSAEMPEEYAGGGSNIWLLEFDSKDPNEVVERQIKLARKAVDKLNKVVEFVEKIVTNKT